MKSILQELYNGNYFGYQRELPREYKALEEKIQPYEEKIAAALGKAFLIEYCNLRTEGESILLEQRYRAGVQFAARFFLEALL